LKQQLLDAIDRAKVVSFDIFDTAVLRTMHKPQDVFSLVYFEGKKKFADFPENFRMKRELAESKVRARFFKKYGSREVALKDIYDEFMTSELISSSLARSIMGLEIAVECMTCVQNPAIFEIYKYSLEQNKTIVFATDMYLPFEILEGILRDNGYKDYRYVYVSNELGKSKREGTMYPYINADLGVRPKDILHIGDDELSDVTMAKRNEFKAWFYTRCRDKYQQDRRQDDTRYVENTTAKSIYKSLIAGKFYSSIDEPHGGYSELDFWYRFGYETVGILYLGFIQWLMVQFKKKGVTHAYFLSRDGYIMEKIYRMLSDDRKDLPLSTYFHASRVALAIASMDELSDEKLELFVSGSELRHVGHYLERLGLDPALYTKEIIASGFIGWQSLVVNEVDRRKLLNLLHMLKDPLLKTTDRQNKLLVKYLKQIGLLNNSKIALVDIGWKASMQCYLLSILKQQKAEVEVNGFYLGTSEEILARKELNGFAKGFLCEGGQPSNTFKTILACVPLCEFLFSANHGSVTGYMEDDNNEVKAKFGRGDIQEQSNVVRLMQQGAMDFITDFTSFSKNYESIQISRELAFAPIARVIQSPQYEESVLIGDLKHVDSFDDVENARYLARPPSIWGIFNIKGLRRRYLQSYWKRGFIERLSHLHHPIASQILKKLKS